MRMDEVAQVLNEGTTLSTAEVTAMLGGGHAPAHDGNVDGDIERTPGAWNGPERLVDQL